MDYKKLLSVQRLRVRSAAKVCGGVKTAPKRKKKSAFNVDPLLLLVGYQLHTSSGV